MLKAFRGGLSRLDLLPVSEEDSARRNAERLQRLWEEEVEAAGRNRRKPNFGRAVFKFARTRFFISALFMMIASFLQFLGPVRAIFL